MIVTINTDASFDHKNEVGAFAFWIISNEFKILKSGLLRKKCSRPEIAEFRCIINALHLVLKEDLSKVDKIIFNTDCLNVIHLINKDKLSIRKYKLNSWGQSLTDKFYLMIINSGYKGLIEMRHVKSHTGISDKRSYVNEWCDTEAKKMLYSKLAEINNRKLIKLT